MQPPGHRAKMQEPSLTQGRSSRLPSLWSTLFIHSHHSSESRGSRPSQRAVTEGTGPTARIRSQARSRSRGSLQTRNTRQTSPRSKEHAARRAAHDSKEVSWGVICARHLQPVEPLRADRTSWLTKQARQRVSASGSTYTQLAMSRAVDLYFCDSGSPYRKG